MKDCYIYNAYGRATAVRLGERMYTLAQVGEELARARADLQRAEGLLADLADGALAQSQSHADVLAKIEAYWDAVFEALPPLSSEGRERVERIARAVLTRIREGQS